MSCLQKMPSACQLRGIGVYAEDYCVLVREDVAEQPAVRGVALYTIRDVLCFCTQSGQTPCRCIAFSYKRPTCSVCFISKFLFQTQKSTLPPFWF